MPTNTFINWGSINSATITNLENLADGNIWQSGKISNPAGNTLEVYLRVWYDCTFNATPVAGDALVFYIAEGDNDTVEIWTADLGESESEITGVAEIASIEQALTPSHVHAWATNHPTGFKGRFIETLVGPEWQILIKADGEALTTGNVIKYQYGTPQAA